MIDLIFPFIVGFVGSLHCLGMCGPLVLAYSLSIPRVAEGAPPGFWRRGLFHHLAFHGGRILTYSCLGALAAGLGRWAGFPGTILDLRGGVTFTGGALMVVMGLVLLKAIPFPLSLPSLKPNSLFGRLLPPLFRSPTAAPKIALGLATGFLPCMLSFAMLVKAATTQNPLHGFYTMALFGLGTAPALFVIGFSASLFSLKARFIGERVAAVSVIAMGLFLIFKGARYFA